MRINPRNTDDPPQTGGEKMDALNLEEEPPNPVTKKPKREEIEKRRNLNLIKPSHIIEA